MTKRRMNPITINEDISCKKDSSQMMLTKILDLEERCQVLQENNENLEQACKRYTSMLENCPVGYVVLDSQGVIIDTNLIVATMVDIQPEKLLGLPFHELLPEQYKGAFSDHLERCKIGEDKTCTEIQIKSSSQKIYSVQIVSFPSHAFDHQKMYYNTAIIDISNQKIVEQELLRLDRLNLVGELAAGIAHEIRNPMTTIRGYLQLFKKRSSQSQEIADLQIMLEELDRANAIITEFLTLAKKTSTKLVMKNVNKIVNSIYPLVQAQALLGGNEIVLELSPHIPEILIEGKELRQVLLNLVSNALQAMEHGQVRIRTYLEEGDILLSVADQGPGIPEEYKEKIGTPFFTTKDSGTGLGLAICYRIVKRHNCTLDFVTGSQGTTFFLRIPNKVS